jgi:hypothetical protein
MRALKIANVALSFLLEMAALAAVAFSALTALPDPYNLIGALAGPVLMAVLWGVFVAPRSFVRMPERLHIPLRFVILQSAAVVLALAGHPLPALLLAALIVLNLALAARWDQ